MGIWEFFERVLFYLGQWDPMNFAPSLRQQRATLEQGRSQSSSMQSCLYLKSLLQHSLRKEEPNKLDLAEGGWGLDINLHLRPVVCHHHSFKNHCCLSSCGLKDTSEYSQPTYPQWVELKNKKQSYGSPLEI